MCRLTSAMQLSSFTCLPADRPFSWRVRKPLVNRLVLSSAHTAMAQDDRFDGMFLGLAQQLDGGIEQVRKKQCLPPTVVASGRFAVMQRFACPGPLPAAGARRLTVAVLPDRCWTFSSGFWGARLTFTRAPSKARHSL